MKLFVGLGNPGSKYERTRHNIGFHAIDAITSAHGFSPARAKFQALLSEGKLGTEKVFALKPQTFMNLSGQSVGEAMRFYKLNPSDVFVFHDELDLPPGKLRVKTGGGHAGHNGLRSCHEHIGPDYHRVRLGIGHPGDKRLVSGYVLHDFAKTDWEWIDPLLIAAADAAPMLAANDPSGFMNKVALKVGPVANSIAKAKPPPEPTSTNEAPTPQPEVKSESPVAKSPFAKLAAHFSRK
ncbi:MAG: aminoacyl-tRNA hydrolase [Rhodobacteraceae bacterium]|nr:aminoacyl-tRNA hydrolase [Paracoccaceae bacterium]